MKPNNGRPGIVLYFSSNRFSNRADSSIWLQAGCSLQFTPTSNTVADVMSS